MSKNPYDTLYEQIDFSTRPFGYSLDYFLWRTSKIKGELAKFIDKDGEILDVGGGTGIMVRFLPKYVDLNKYHNLDISAKIMKYSPHQNVLGTAEQIPYTDNSFDFVILSEVLEHVKDKTLALRECFRILRADQLLLCSTPRTGWLKSFWRSPFAVFMLFDRVMNKLGKKDRFYSVEGVKDEPSDEDWLRNELTNVGFTVLKQYRVDNHVPWRRNGESRLWRWFADKFVNPEKYGHCTIVICKKRSQGQQT
jgi:ubiquinone/menaquinone biosynthesis C-methylase UbiE